MVGWQYEMLEEEEEKAKRSQKAKPINHKMHFWVPRASVAGSLLITRVNAIKLSIKFVERVKLTQARRDDISKFNKESFWPKLDGVVSTDL